MSNIGSKIVIFLAIAAVIDTYLLTREMSEKKTLAQECREVLGVELVTEGTSPGVAGAQRKIALQRLREMAEQAYDGSARANATLHRAHEIYDLCLSGQPERPINLKQERQ